MGYNLLAEMGSEYSTVPGEWAGGNRASTFPKNITSKRNIKAKVKIKHAKYDFAVQHCFFFKSQKENPLISQKRKRGSVYVSTDHMKRMNYTEIGSDFSRVTRGIYFYGLKHSLVIHDLTVPELD